jgi:hypothetical protein
MGIFKMKDCTHPKEPVIKVLGATCTCEVTVLICPDCKKHLTEPETDC